MMVETSDLIDRLARSAAPVRRLPRPPVRAALWLALAVPYVAAIVIVMAPHGDLPLQRADPRFLLEQAAASATAVLAAIAAFSLVVPGRRRAVCLLPAVPLAVWLASLGLGCLEDWARWGPGALRILADWDCLPPGIVAGIAPALLMLTMLRRGAPLFPRGTVAMAALAVGALTNAGLQLYHAGGASIMVLVWHLGSVAVLSCLAGWLGPRVLHWPGSGRAPDEGPARAGP